MLAALFARFTWVLCLYVVAIAGCTTITSIVEIDCERIEFYPPDATAMTADSAVYRGCDRAAYEGMVVRFRSAP